MCTWQRTLFKSAFTFNYLYCSQVWFPTVQDVLQADWQDVWHSPHPPFLIVFCNFLVFNVFTCFILYLLFISMYLVSIRHNIFTFHIIAQPNQSENPFFQRKTHAENITSRRMISSSKIFFDSPIFITTVAMTYVIQ